MKLYDDFIYYVLNVDSIHFSKKKNTKAFYTIQNILIYSTKFIILNPINHLFILS